MQLLERILYRRSFFTSLNRLSSTFRLFYTSNLSNTSNIAHRLAGSDGRRGEDGRENLWRMRRKVVCTSPDLFPHTPDGLCFDVAYLDSGAEWNDTKKQSSPTILAVHGCPATHDDVMPVVKPFHNKGCRVIALNMPGYEHTQGVSKTDHDLFTHSTPEIAEFLGHFLTTMEIERVDMLVGHSGGTLPSTTFAGVSSRVGAIMHLCPPPGHTPPRSARPYHLIKLLPRIYDTRAGKYIMRPLIPYVNRKLSGLNSDRPSHLVSAAKYVANIDFDLLQIIAKDLDQKKVPSLFVYSRNDSLVEWHLSKEWAKMLGFEEENFDEYDNEFIQVGSAVEMGVEDYKKGVVFGRGGHFPQFKTRTALPILIREAEKLLKVSLEKSKKS